MAPVALVAGQDSEQSWRDIEASWNIAGLSSFDEGYRFYRRHFRTKTLFLTIYRVGTNWYSSTATAMDNGQPRLFKEDPLDYTVSNRIRGLTAAQAERFVSLWGQNRPGPTPRQVPVGLDTEGWLFESYVERRQSSFEYWVSSDDPRHAAFERLKRAFEELTGP